MLLSLSEINDSLKEVSEWNFIENELEKKFVFKNFKEAMDFINKIAIIAEEIHHHPEWKNVYNKVTIKLTTHDFGGVSKKDFDLAKAIDKVLFEF